MTAPTHPSDPDPPSATPGTAARSVIKSLDKVMQVLECFSRRDANLTPADIATRTGLPRATAHRLASTLRDIGLLEQNGRRDTYKLGMKLFQFGSLVLANLDLDKRARPHTTRLQHITGETVHLCVFDGSEMAFVERHETGSAANTAVTRIEATPVFCTGVGKAFLAFQEALLIDRIIDEGLSRRTTHTLTDPQALRDDLQRTRERGYAVDNEENEPGIRCLAAPVRDANGQVIAAISVSGPVERIAPARIEGLAPIVRETADAVSRELGWSDTAQRRPRARQSRRSAADTSPPTDALDV